MSLDMKSERWSSAVTCYGADTFSKIQSAKVLVIGAGGIGCELLKNLVLSGFKHIDIVDLDTIDISNLNRQFLFRRHHVGQPKSFVAKESAMNYVDESESEIKAHHDDVKTLKYGPEYIKEFDLVLNALDNLSARRHVGRICLMAGIPCVESGTAGWLGQVQPFIPSKTGCFECEPKAPPTTFPVCTIRSNPSKPIHTILWAKHLFSRLFGKETDENTVSGLDDQTSSENAQYTSNQNQSNGEHSNDAGNKSEDFGKDIFDKVFNTDILSLKSLAHLWIERKPPTPYTYDYVMSDESFAQVQSSSETQSSSATNATMLEDQKLWSIQKCANVFLDTCNKLKQLMDQAGPEGLSWDKDEPLHLDFVVAASNIRSSQFYIPLQSKFTIKSDAGNIIPAIATTNAIIAGLIVLEAIKILTNRTEESSNVYLLRRAGRNGLLVASKPQAKNPNCYVCSNQFVQVNVDTEEVTIKTFLEEVLLKHLGMLEPAIMVEDDIIFESGGDFDHQLKKTLHETKIQHNSVVHLEDYSLDFKLELSINHVPKSRFEDPANPFEIASGNPSRKAVEESKPEQKKTEQADQQNEQDSDDDLIICEDSDDELEIVDVVKPAVNGKKRTHEEMAKSEEEDSNEAPTKKAKTAE